MNHVPSPRKLSSWFPLGPYLRVIFVLLSILFPFTDVVSGTYQVTDIRSLWELVVGYLPLLLLANGVISGIYSWYFSLITISVFYSGSADMWSTFLAPAIFVPLYCSYLSNIKNIIGFGVINFIVFILEFILTGQLIPFQFLVLFIALFSYIIGFSFRYFRRRHGQKLQYITDLQVAQRRARKEERTRLAHELHDIVAHEVTVIAMQARRAQFAKDPQQTERILTSIGDSASQALDDLRKLVSVLKADDAEETQEQNELTPTSSNGLPQLLDEKDLSGETTTAIALTHDLHKIAEALENAGFNVALNITGNVSLIPATWRQILRRTTREIGTNILKHASHREPVQIALSVSKNKVTLASANTISAEKPISSTRTGLESITARFDALGGTTTFNEAGGIWSIQVVLPLSP